MRESKVTQSATVESEHWPKPDSPLLEVHGLKTYFFMQQGLVRAVNGVDFTIYRGKTLGVVGESGCGKSVTARSILRTVAPPGRIVEGEILLHRELDSDNGVGGNTMVDVVDLVKLNPKGRENPQSAQRDNLDDLPGAHDLAQPGSHHRKPDHRDYPAAPRYL